MEFKLVELQTEYLAEPLGLDTLKPRFSWRVRTDREGMRQTAFRIKVASSLAGLAAEVPDMWDSGTVNASQMTQVRYEGIPLQSKRRYYWQVRIWDETGQAGEWSDPAWWEMGLLRDSDWEAEWIGRRPEPSEAGAARPAPYYRKTFATDQNIRQARVYVSGLGYYELFLNGEKVGDRVLEPGVTNYEKTVLYSVYDVTAQLQATSRHALGLQLGRGRYAQKTANVWKWEQSPWHDEPKLILRLDIEYEDGTGAVIVSDESWKTADSPLLFDCLYAGEQYDARLERTGWNTYEHDDRLWQHAVKVSVPEGRLQAQTYPPIRIVEEVRAQRIVSLGANRYLFDFGKQMSGWARLTVTGEGGHEMTLKYGEKIAEDGSVTLEQDHVTGEIQVDTYVLKGGQTESWEPKFSYKGFQYVEVRNYPGTPSEEALVAKVLYNDVKPTGDFRCSNELLNRLHENARRAIVSNLHSIPTDTPVFEKNGWTGDAQLTAEAAIYNFSMSSFYIKWLVDVDDSLHETGEMAPIVPTTGWGYDSTPFGWKAVQGPVPAWDAALVMIPWWCYWYYGDADILRNHFDAMKKYMQYLQGQAKDGIIWRGLGDWLAPKRGNAAEGPALVSTAYYYLMAQTMSKIAGVLGEAADRHRFAALSEEIGASFNRHFYDPDRNTYQTASQTEYRQTSNILPIAFGLIPPADADKAVRLLADDIRERDYHLNTGIFGTKYIMQVLTDFGYVDLAYRLAVQTTYPSWGYWVEQGATSMWEFWEPDSRSLNHHMFGTIEDWFYQSLAGIRAEGPGFTSIQVRPTIPAELSSAYARVDTPFGPVDSGWSQSDDGELTLTVTVPTGAVATVHVPLPDGGKVPDFGQPRSAEYRAYEVTAGKHEWIVNMKEVFKR